MSSSVRWAAVVVALALMAVVGFAVLGRPSDSGIIGVSPSDSSAPTDSPRTPDSSTPAASPEPSGPLGGGLILAYERAKEGALGVYSLDAGTGERTLLGTLPTTRHSSRPYSFQWADDRHHVMIADPLGWNRVKALDNPTAAARDYAFVCCAPLPEKPGDPDFHSWVLSPNGRQLAGLRMIGITVPGQEGELGVDDAIALFDVETGSVRILPLPSKTQVFGVPAWSPDGTAIVVAGCRPCNNADGAGGRPTAIQHERLLLVPADGGPVRDLVEVTGATFGSAAWSPDGSTISILYSACRPGEQSPNCSAGRKAQIVLVKDGQRSVVADASDEAGPPVWSPDGRRIAFDDGGDIFVINVDGSQKAKLAEGSDPRWSPDSQWLLYEVPAADFEPGDLWVVSADGGEPRLVGAYQGGAW